MDGDEDLEFCDAGGDDPETDKFDSIVGALQDFMMDPDFEASQSTFCRAHCSHFEESEENKLVYTELFEQYTTMLEKAIDDRLTEQVEDFSMGEFIEALKRREGEGELEGEVFDMLMTLSEFDAFKELMLSYKFEGERAGLSLDAEAMHVYADEQEDGEERPDLDCELTVTSLNV